MKRYLYPFLLPLLPLLPLLAHAQKWDYQWPMGYEFQSTTIPDISLLDFTDDTVAIYGHAFANNLGFGANSSFICDSAGHLLLLTNNCAVYDTDFHLVPGTNMLTPGWGYDMHCDDQSYGGYIGRQLTLFLPQVGSDSVIYLAHKDNIINDTPFTVLSTKLYVSTLVREPTGGFHLKQKRQMLDGFYNTGHLTACLHADGDKWWTGMVGHNTNRFEWVLVGGQQDTVQGPFVQEVGPPLADDSIGISQAAFSPDGTMLAFNSDVLKKVYLYGFDNATGWMTAPQLVPYPPGGEWDIGLGVSFSPGSRFVYANTDHDLYQVDLEQGNEVVHIAHHASLDEDNWPVAMGNMTLGPDCRLYIGPGSTTYYLHVVHHPDEKGAACGFEARALRSPSNLSFDVPNLPMYRFGGSCDSTIQFPYKDTVNAIIEPQLEETAKVFPNPCRGHFTVSFPEGAPTGARLLLFDGLGRPCREGGLPALNNVFDVGELPSGLYHWEVRETEGKLLGSGKLVKTE